MEIVKAEPQHLDGMCRISEQAKAQLKRMELNQWQKGYPNRQVWEEDIQKGDAWVAVEEGTVLGVFAYLTAPELSYARIDGAWLTDGAYASLHRVCVADECKGRGVAGAMFRHGFALARAAGLPSVRIDTHHGNLPMQRALAKEGFQPCGDIILADGAEAGDPRLAYERLL